MFDPSFLLTEPVLSWLEDDAEARSVLAVSRSLVDRLWRPGDFDVSSLLAPEDAERFGERRDRAEPLLRDATTFSHRDVALRPRSLDEVRLNLLLERDPLAEINADEWAFLQSHSILLSNLRRPIAAFRDAGAVVVEFGRKTGVRLAERVIPKEHLPETFTRQILVKAAAKWVVLGGATVGGGTLAGVAGSALGGPAGAVLAGKAGGFVAQSVTQAALLAIDP